MTWLAVVVLVSSSSAACSGNQNDSDEPVASGSNLEPAGDGEMPDGEGGGDVAQDPADVAGVGDTCETDDQCPAGGSGTPMCLTDGYQDGYCSVVECENHGHDCPDDAGLAGDEGAVKCVQLDVLQCMRLCTTADDCRAGYECVSVADAAGHGNVDVCAPAGAVAGDGGGAGEGEMGEGGGMMGGGGDGGGGMGDGMMGGGGEGGELGGGEEAGAGDEGAGEEGGAGMGGEEGDADSDDDGGEEGGGEEGGGDDGGGMMGGGM